MSRQIILASTSPRRRELLRQIGVDFAVTPSPYEEDMTLPMEPTELVQHLAEEKAKAVAIENPEAIVIGADTIVVLDNEALGKPKSVADAKAMLQRLSGRQHQVMTGYSVICVATGKAIDGVSIADVSVRKISDQEIADYVATGEPMDKAGAYAIQGRAAIFIDSINGDYAGVVGLPVSVIYRAIRELQSQEG